MDLEQVETWDPLAPEREEADFGHRLPGKWIAGLSTGVGVSVYLTVLFGLPWADRWLERMTHAAPWQIVSSSPIGVASGIGLMLGFFAGAVCALWISGSPNDPD